MGDILFIEFKNDDYIFNKYLLKIIPCRAQIRDQTPCRDPRREIFREELQQRMQDNPHLASFVRKQLGSVDKPITEETETKLRRSALFRMIGGSVVSTGAVITSGLCTATAIIGGPFFVVMEMVLKNANGIDKIFKGMGRLGLLAVASGVAAGFSIPITSQYISNWHNLNQVRARTDERIIFMQENPQTDRVIQSPSADN